MVSSAEFSTARPVMFSGRFNRSRTVRLSESMMRIAGSLAGDADAPGVVGVVGWPVGWVKSGICAYKMPFLESMTWPVIAFDGTALGSRDRIIVPGPHSDRANDAQPIIASEPSAE